MDVKSPDSWKSPRDGVGQPWLRFSTDQYDGYHANNEGSVILLGLPGFRDHMHGAVTDVNVFSRILSGEEVGDWARCRGQPGDLLDWRTAQLDITNLETEEGQETVGC